MTSPQASRAVNSRSLRLHSSALSNKEYEVYTASLSRLCNFVGLLSKPLIWEAIEVGYGEARGALRERYGDRVDVMIIDKVGSSYEVTKTSVSLRLMYFKDPCRDLLSC